MKNANKTAGLNYIILPNGKGGCYYDDNIRDIETDDKREGLMLYCPGNMDVYITDTWFGVQNGFMSMVECYKPKGKKFNIKTIVPLPLCKHLIITVETVDNFVNYFIETVKVD